MSSPTISESQSKNFTVNEDDVMNASKAHFYDLTEGQNTLGKLELKARLNHMGQIDMPPVEPGCYSNCTCTSI